MVGQLRMGLLHQILNIVEVEVAWIQGQAQGVQVVQPFLTKQLLATITLRKSMQKVDPLH